MFEVMGSCARTGAATARRSGSVRRMTRARWDVRLCLIASSPCVWRSELERPAPFSFGALRVNGLGAEHGLYNVAIFVEGYEGIHRHRGLWTGGIWDDLVGISRQPAEYAGGAGGLCFADGVVEAARGAGPPVSEEVDVARDRAGRAGRH